MSNSSAISVLYFPSHSRQLVCLYAYDVAKRLKSGVNIGRTVDYGKKRWNVNEGQLSIATHDATTPHTSFQSHACDNSADSCPVVRAAQSSVTSPAGPALIIGSFTPGSEASTFTTSRSSFSCLGGEQVKKLNKLEAENEQWTKRRDYCLWRARQD